MTPLTIAFSFLSLAIALLLIDLILPTAGILLALSILCGIAADIFAFRAGRQIGIWMLIGELALVPIGAYLFVKWWPLTVFGRRMIIQRPVSQPFTWESQKLVGKEGVAIEDFLPTGRIQIDGKLFDAMSTKVTIVKDQRVVVVDEEMGQLFVAPKEATAAMDSFSKTNSPSSSNSVSSLNSAGHQSALSDPTKLPAENLGLQSLDG